MCFVDYQKAFDCVRWKQLWKVLLEAGVPAHLVLLIRSLYEKGYGTVKVAHTTSGHFQFQKGVRQGCVISPILFNIYGEHIMRKTLEGWKGGIKIGGAAISNLRYADDTTLFASTEEEMADLLTRLEQCSKDFGLTINKEKTKLMLVDRSETFGNTGILGEYDTVDQFLYLGSVLNNRGNCEPEIRRRIGMAKAAMTQLQKVWKDSSISNRTKIRIIDTLVIPIFLYGCESWTIKAADKRRIDAFEMWCWRRMLRIPWTAHRTNISILKQLHLERRPKLSATCLHRTLKYFGHIARREPDNLEKLLIVGKLAGKRRRGRTPKRWVDQVANTLKVPIHTALHQAEDRSWWREVIKTIESHDPQ